MQCTYPFSILLNTLIWEFLRKHSYVIFIISFKDMKENAMQFYHCILQEGMTAGML